MSGYSDISFSQADGIARITVERPGKLNAYRNETADELHDALGRAEADPAIRVAILTGAGRAFGAGYDLRPYARRNPSARPCAGTAFQSADPPHATIATANHLAGQRPVRRSCRRCGAGGDIVMAARSAYFYEPFVGIALVPDAGNTLFLPRLIGRIRAAPTMFLGDRISAEEALSWGMVWRVHDDAELTAEVDKIAIKLAALAPDAIAATKRLIGAATDFGMDEQLDLERDLQGIAGRTPEMKQAIAAFFAKKRS